MEEKPLIKNHNPLYIVLTRKVWLCAIKSYRPWSRPTPQTLRVWIGWVFKTVRFSGSMSFNAPSSRSINKSLPYNREYCPVTTFSIHRKIHKNGDSKITREINNVRTVTMIRFKCIFRNDQYNEKKSHAYISPSSNNIEQIISTERQVDDTLVDSFAASFRREILLGDFRPAKWSNRKPDRLVSIFWISSCRIAPSSIFVHRQVVKFHNRFSLLSHSHGFA